MFLMNPDENDQFTIPNVLAAAPSGADKQVLVSWAIARDFGHGWAGACHYLPDAPECAYLGTHMGRNLWQNLLPETWEEVDRAWKAMDAACADTDSDPGLPPGTKHTSHSGRFSWEVAANGDLTVSINRPTGAVCGIRNGQIWRAKPGSPTGAPQARHLRALAWVLRLAEHPEYRRYAELADRLDGDIPLPGGYVIRQPLPTQAPEALPKRGGRDLDRAPIEDWG